MMSIGTYLFGNDRLRFGLMAVFGLGFLGLSLPMLADPLLFWTDIVFGGHNYPSHELHHFVLGIVMGLLILGLVVQVYRPSQRTAALHTSIAIWGWFTIFFTIGQGFEPMFIVLLLLLGGVAVFHPAGKDQFPIAESLARPLGYITLLTAVAAFAFAGNELIAHRTLADSHVTLGHYLFMATGAASVGTLMIRGSFTERDWRFALYAAAACMIVFGAASIGYPGAEQGSSIGVIGGLVVIIWAIGILVVAERFEGFLSR